MQNPNQTKSQPALSFVAALVRVGVLLLLAGVASAQETFRWDFSDLATSHVIEPRCCVPVVGAGMKVAVERPFVRPQDRYVEVLVEVADQSVPPGKLQLKAQVFGIGSPKCLAQSAMAPEAERALLFVDLRSLQVEAARLSLALHHGNRLLAATETMLSRREVVRPAQPGDRVEILMDLPSGIGRVVDWPVTFGVPFPAGMLWKLDRLRLVDAGGRVLPAQKTVTGRWALDGAIQWVRLDALVSEPGGCFVELTEGEPASAEPHEPVHLTENGATVTVQIGQAQYVLGRGASPIREIRLGPDCVASAGRTRGLYIVDQKGQTASASADGASMTVEARGPVAACVRFEGPYRAPGGQELARHITRLEFFAGQPAVSVTHTLILTRDTNEVWFTEVGWALEVRPGAKARGMFGVSRTEWAKSLERPVADGRAVYMLQDDYVQFSGGRKHFVVAGEDRAGRAETVLEGEECGDWAVVLGDGGGLAVSCREAARQHPKEFAVSGDRLSLKLFSNRAGEELDFRPKALLRRWNKGGMLTGDWPDRVLKLPTNAVGWAKTHQFFFRPCASADSIAELARRSHLHSQPVLALTDPKWIHRSRVMGPLHPRYPERFPEAEEHIERTFKQWYDSVFGLDEYGFVDYWAGPHCAGARMPVSRFRSTYTLRNDVWLLYARSGDRRAHEFATNTARTFMDNLMASWDGPGRTRGLFLAAFRSDYDSLPYYWEKQTQPERSTDTNLSYMLNYYHLCGYRRGRDVVEEYIRGVSRWWNPEWRTWRPIMLLRCLMQAYALTWAPDLRAKINEVANFLYDPETTVALTKDRPYASPTYKTQSDVSTLIRAYDLFGTPRFHEMATKVARHWWDRQAGRRTNNRFQRGIVGDFLYEQTRDPAIPATLALSIRQEAGETRPTGISHVVARFQAIPYAQSVVARTDADRSSLVSWAGCDGFGCSTSFVVYKKPQETIRLRVNVPHGHGLTAHLNVRPVGPSTVYGLGGLQVHERIERSYQVLIPKDADEGAYEIRATEQGSAVAIANARVPLVVYAPQYFRPVPELQRPFARIFFRLPEGEDQGQVFFDGSARLLDPSGSPFRGGEPLRGWIDLPADKPGLWSFQPVENWLVRVRNLPPFFAFDDPAFFFEPKLPWQRIGAVPAVETIPDDLIYASGPSDDAQDRSLHLSGSRVFELAPGPRHPSGEGTQFLPFREGTIEFYLKPGWSTSDLWPKGERTLVLMPCPDSSWRLRYVINPQRAQTPMRRLYSHSLWGSFATTSPTASTQLFTGMRRTIVERGEWIHIAWVWGQEDYVEAHRTKQRIPMSRIYVNGRAGESFRRIYPGARPKHLPQSFQIGPSFDGCIDKLRISDTLRYTGAFTPPPVDRPLKVDEHTRAAFEFNGDVEGRSFGHTGPLPAKLEH